MGIEVGEEFKNRFVKEENEFKTLMKLVFVICEEKDDNMFEEKDSKFSKSSSVYESLF
jgi:hypothetical protein